MKVNDILLGDTSRLRGLSHGDLYMMDDTDTMEEVEACDMMDLATFLEYALSRCSGGFSLMKTSKIRHPSYSLFGAASPVRKI